MRAPKDMIPIIRDAVKQGVYPAPVFYEHVRKISASTGKQDVIISVMVAISQCRAVYGGPTPKIRFRRCKQKVQVLAELSKGAGYLQRRLLTDPLHTEGSHTERRAQLPSTLLGHC